MVYLDQKLSYFETNSLFGGYFFPFFSYFFKGRNISSPPYPLPWFYIRIKTNKKYIRKYENKLVKMDFPFSCLPLANVNFNTKQTRTKSEQFFCCFFLNFGWQNFRVSVRQSLKPENFRKFQRRWIVSIILSRFRKKISY